MLRGHTRDVLAGGIGPRQEFVDFAVGVAVDDFRDDVGEIGLRVDGVELASLDERSDDGPMFTAAVGTGEERVFAVECDGADGALDNVGVDLDASVVDEARETLPARERVSTRL